MSQASVIVHAEPKVLAQSVAARLIVKLTDAQAGRGSAAVVLTGGRIAKDAYAAVRDSPARDAVDWSRVDLWWGDERFVASDDPERNETAGPRVAARRAAAQPGAGAPDGALRRPRRRRPGVGGRALCRRAGPGRQAGHGPAAAFRRRAARGRRGRPRRLGLPRAPGRLRGPRGRGRAGQPETATGPAHPHPAGDSTPPKRCG